MRRLTHVSAPRPGEDIEIERHYRGRIAGRQLALVSPHWGRAVRREDPLKLERKLVAREDPNNYRTGAGMGGPRQTVPTLTKRQRARLKGN